MAPTPRALLPARPALCILLLAPAVHAAALPAHAGVRVQLPAHRRASTRLSVTTESDLKEPETPEGPNWPLAVAVAGTGLVTAVHWTTFTEFVQQWQESSTPTVRRALPKQCDIW